MQDPVSKSIIRKGKGKRRVLNLYVHFFSFTEMQPFGNGYIGTEYCVALLDVMYHLRFFVIIFVKFWNLQN